MLLERPGEVISREEMQRRLWPADTFVDFDHSLNAAVKRLRDALRDSADNPRFVETLARRGYRFVAPVAGALPSNGTAEIRTAPEAKHIAGWVLGHWCSSGRVSRSDGLSATARHGPFRQKKGV